MTTNIQKTLKPYANPTDAQYMEDYMKGQFIFLGIKTPLRRQLTKEYVSTISKLKIDEIIKNIDELWKLEEREYQMIGLDIMNKTKKKFDAGHISKLENWIAQKSWWDTVDLIASHNIGDLFNRDKELLSAKTKQWIKSENIWLNRVCLLFQLKYKEQVDLDLLFGFIDALNHKDEFFIQKAIGWSLRQASKFYPDEIRIFLSSRDLSPLAFREGSKYV